VPQPRGLSIQWFIPSIFRHHLAGFIVASLVALAAVVSSQTAPPPTLTLLARDGRRALPLTVTGDQEFVALDDLATAFQLAVREESLGAITVSYKGKTIVVQPAQALASVSGRLISLPAPLTRNGRRWLVPVEFISRALATIYDVKLDLRKPSRLLVVGDLRVPRIVARYEPAGTSGRLTIDATPRATSTVTQDGDRITIKFEADALDAPAPLLAPQGAQSPVARVVDPATVVVELGARFTGFKASTQVIEPTQRLVIDLAAQAEPAPAAAPFPAPATPDLPALSQATPPFRTLVIDPGHGGTGDDGAAGASGAKEKDLVLAIARRARAAIEGRLGIRVLLTRDDDRHVAIDERTAMANNNKADLFISLHASASPRPSASGATIFSAAFDKASLPAVSADRVPAFNGAVREIELVPWEQAQSRHLDQSTSFAEVLQGQLHDRIPLAGEAMASAPLRVLESANMPAVLVELGYLTNKEQETLLTGDAFANAFVQALTDAVVRYRDALAAGGAR
jgi:N-acetylmuramoyl-L-alanine amidase